MAKQESSNLLLIGQVKSDSDQTMPLNPNDRILYFDLKVESNSTQNKKESMLPTIHYWWQN